uniref:Protein yippee-like 2 n=1 Tax=Oncorhynchus kisutch TaxID=8019 RepID=A0A8C7FK24_ONCKI
AQCCYALSLYWLADTAVNLSPEEVQCDSVQIHQTPSGHRALESIASARLSRLERKFTRKECEEGFRFGIATRKTRRCDFLSGQHIFFFYSKSFQGSQGRAYLFNSVVNVGCGPAEERVLLTGLHAVADIYCENCKTTLGWKYVSVRVCTCRGGGGVEQWQILYLEWQILYLECSGRYCI